MDINLLIFRLITYPLKILLEVYIPALWILNWTENLTPLQQKIRQVKGADITERLLALEKKQYLAENEKGLNEYEKKQVEKTKNLANLKKNIRE